MSESLMHELVSCGDNSCTFAPPKGVGTNGGCRCFKSINDSDKRWQLQRNAQILKYEIGRLNNVINDRTNIIQNQEQEIKRLREALKWIADKEPQARQAVNEGWHNTTFAIDLSGYAKQAIEKNSNFSCASVAGSTEEPRKKCPNCGMFAPWKGYPCGCCGRIGD